MIPEIILPHYTIEDYNQWEGDWELVKGIPFMSPSPVAKHQRVLNNLQFAFTTALKKKKNFFIAPELDYIVSNDTVLRPDLAIYFNFDHKNYKYPTEAPILAIEILSASSVEHDMKNKRKVYEEAGVRYYLVVDPDREEIKLLGFNSHWTSKNNIWSFELLDNVSVDMNEIFT